MFRRSNLRGSVLVCGGLLLTIAVYAQSLSWGYVYEDTNRPQAWTGWHMPSAFAQWADALLWHAVGELTAYHARWQRIVSLCLHLLNGGLIARLASRLRCDAVGVAVAVGLFLLHPLQIESVAAIAYRSELLIGLCVLTALLCVERGWLLAAGCVTLSALLMKPAAVVVLALVPVWAWWRRASTGTAALYWAMVCWPVLLVGVDLLRGGVRPYRLFWAPVESMAHTLAAWTLLLTQWVIPTPQTIDPDWAVRVTPLVLAFTFTVWTSAIALAWQARRSMPPWSALLVLWLGVLIAPRALWQLGEGLHEHHLYTATIPLSLVVGRAFTKDTV